MRFMHSNDDRSPERRPRWSARALSDPLLGRCNVRSKQESRLLSKVNVSLMTERAEHTQRIEPLNAETMAEAKTSTRLLRDDFIQTVETETARKQRTELMTCINAAYQQGMLGSEAAQCA